jgi:hypothetical protein
VSSVTGPQGDPNCFARPSRPSGASSEIARCSLPGRFRSVRPAPTIRSWVVLRPLLLPTIHPDVSVPPQVSLARKYLEMRTSGLCPAYRISLLQIVQLKPILFLLKRLSEVRAYARKGEDARYIREGWSPRSEYGAPTRLPACGCRLCYGDFGWCNAFRSV